MQIYLHIGTHKTGTTEIQNLLKEHSGLVKENKRLLYVPFNEVFSAISKQQKPSNDLSQKLKNHILDVISKNESVSKYEDLLVISFENFSGLTLSGYKNSEAIANILYDAVKDFSEDSKIIVYLRRQDLFIESLYTQFIHQGEFFSFNDFLSRFDSNFICT